VPLVFHNDGTAMEQTTARSSASDGLFRKLFRCSTVPSLPPYICRSFATGSYPRAHVTKEQLSEASFLTGDFAVPSLFHQGGTVERFAGAARLRTAFCGAFLAAGAARPQIQVYHDSFSRSSISCPVPCFHDTEHQSYRRRKWKSEAVFCASSASRASSR
jgi:hypothetical protein